MLSLHLIELNNLDLEFFLNILVGLANVCSTFPTNSRTLNSWEENIDRVEGIQFVQGSTREELPLSHLSHTLINTV